MSSNSLSPSWVSTISGSSFQTAFTSTATTSTGFTYVGGFYCSDIPKTISGSALVLPANTQQPIVVIKYTYDGIAISGIFATGNTSLMTLEDMKIDSSDNIYITGTYRSTVDITFGNSIIPASGTSQFGFLIKLNQNLSVIWIKTINILQSQGLYDTRGKLYIDTVTNSILLGGVYSSNATITLGGAVTLPTTSALTSFVAKYDLNGNALYAKRIGNGVQPTTSSPSRDITTDLSGNVYLVGSYANNAGSNLSFTVDSVTFPAGTIQRSYILRLSDTLTANLLELFPTGSSNNSINSIVTDSSNNIYVTGFYSSSTALTFGSVTLPITATGTSVFIVKCLSGSIAPNTGITILGTESRSINLYNNNLFITGDITGAISRNLGNGVTLNSSLASGIFLLKYNTNLIAQAAAQIPTDSVGIMYSTSIDTSNNIYGAIQYGGGPYTLSGGVVIPESPSALRGAGFIKYLDISPPLTPTGLTATSQQLAVNLNWNPSPNATEYKVYYGLSGSFGLSGIFTTTSATISGLTGGSWYNFRVSARNSAGESAQSTAVFSIPISDTPTGLSATAQIRAIDLTWNSSIGANGYNIYYGLSGFLDLSATFSGVSGTISGLSGDYYYNFTVTAYNIGGESTQSSAVYGLPLIPTPSGLTAVSRVESVDLSWNSITEAVSYRVYYGLSGSFDLSAEFFDSSGTVSSLLAGSPYNFAVTAVGSQGTETAYSNIVYAIPISQTPTNFTSSAGIESVILSWNSSTSANSYTIIYGLSGSFDLSASFSGLSGYIGGLAAGDTYNFAIASVNDGGQSPFSTPIYDIPITAIPTGLSAISAVEAVNLSWDTVSGATSYKIYYGLSGLFDLNTIFSGLSGTISGLSAGSWYNFVISSIGPGGESPLSSPVYAMPISLPPTGLVAYPLNLAINLTWDTVSGTSFYTVYYGVSGTYTNIVTSVLTNKNISGLTYGFTYNFKVTATNLGGESDFSTAVFEEPLPAIPSVPIGLTASGVSSGAFLEWTASIGADYYKIYYGLSGSFDIIKNISGGLTISDTISPLTPATVYNFKILAGNTGGESALSTAVFATPFYNPVSTPSGFTVVPNFNSVDMSWNSVVDATYYIVFYGLDGITFDSSASFISSPGSITGLSGGITYYFYIVAANPDFISASGGVISATPLIQPPDAPILLSAIPGIYQVTLNWSSSTLADNYYVIYGIFGIFDMSMNFPGTGTSGTISGLTTITLYNFAVIATNAGGESAQSNVLTATPNSPANPIIPSYIIQPVIVGHIDIILNIFSSPDADLYRIYYSQASGDFDFFIDTVDTQNIIISYLIPDTLYKLKVRTISGLIFVDSSDVYIRTLANESNRTLYSNNNSSAVTLRNESTAVYIYKQLYDETGKTWTFRSDRERMLYLEGLRRNRADK